MYGVVLIYLVAIAAANLLAAAFGPGITILSAFLFIGLDLSLRDKLHDYWQHRNLPLKMGGLIFAGGLISYLINADAGRIAIASTVAFGVSAIVDATLYQLLINRHPLERVNYSNIPAAAVDSILFPTIAFGTFLPLVVLGQFLAKVFGGAIWGWLIYRRKLARADSQRPSQYPPLEGPGA
jgi:queuosine precursor transporter